MNLRTLIGALVLSALPGTVMAEDWVSGFYAKIYAGATLPDELRFNSADFDINAGYALGGAIGIETGINGLSVELDVLHSRATYAEGVYAVLSGTSIMGNLVYEAKVDDMFGLYGGAGAGVTFLDYDRQNDYFDASGTDASFQLFAGVSAALTDSVDLFAEYRYLGTFDQPTLKRDNSAFTYPIGFRRNMIMGGLKAHF